MRITLSPEEITEIIRDKIETRFCIEAFETAFMLMGVSQESKNRYMNEKYEGELDNRIKAVIDKIKLKKHLPKSFDLYPLRIAIKAKIKKFILEADIKTLFQIVAEWAASINQERLVNKMSPILARLYAFNVKSYEFMNLHPRYFTRLDHLASDQAYQSLYQFLERKMGYLEWFTNTQNGRYLFTISGFLLLMYNAYSRSQTENVAERQEASYASAKRTVLLAVALMCFHLLAQFYTRRVINQSLTSPRLQTELNQSIKDIVTRQLTTFNAQTSSSTATTIVHLQPLTPDTVTIPSRETGPAARRGGAQRAKRWLSRQSTETTSTPALPPTPVDNYKNVIKRKVATNLWIDPDSVKNFVEPRDTTKKKSLVKRFFSIAAYPNEINSRGYDQTGIKISFDHDGKGQWIKTARLKIAGTPWRLRCDVDDVNGREIITPVKLVNKG